MESRYKSVQRTTINWDAAILADATPAPKLTLQQEIKILKAKIADAEETIRAYASSPRVVTMFQANVVVFEAELAELELAQRYVETDTQAGKVRKALRQAFYSAAFAYPTELYKARRAAFVTQITERGN